MIGDRWLAQGFRQVASSPLTTIVWAVYTFSNYLIWKLASSGYQRWPPIRVVCVSDTHSQRCDIPYGEILIHAGDLSLNGSAVEIQDTINWLKSLPHPHKVVICGNSDRFFDACSRIPDDATYSVSSLRRERTASCQPPHMMFDWGEIHYLQQTSVSLTFPGSFSDVQRQVNIYGAPQVPLCGGPENAFQYPVDHDPWRGNIPESTDILVTHTPPKFHLDWYQGSPEGCPFLLQELWKIRPLLHVFGHVHTAYGVERVHWDSSQGWWERYCLGLSKLSGISCTELFQPQLLWDAAMVLLSAIFTVAKEMVGPRRNERSSTLMVNAACMDGDGLSLSNDPIVVEI
ncbi:metallophosphatase domain-containing protein [Aspergillus alliaceus]|uniref:metallophosphatase domain-containing protein n=1 Tax=Petromyces alliaceus TaxID=209559 RepID=UPI0012A64976|nr:Metallo-dependent phosphatase [Aspergillus alliaceus]KAB8229710.1 Metallo-dependent phosphatase [Aspergillus alliaceus]